MHRPPTQEGEIWLERYWSCFMRWARSSFSDAAALEEAVTALRFLLERCPDYAAEVERIASVACFASRRGQVPQLIAKLAQCGLEAGAMAAAAGRSGNASAILLLSLAEAELHAERRLAGLDALRRLEQRLQERRADDPLACWIHGRMHALLAELHELGLEEQQARQAYTAALQEIEPLLVDPGKRDAFIQAWADAMVDETVAETPRQQIQDEIALLDLKNLATSSAIGLARSLPADASREERAAAARKAWHTIETYGTPPDLSPFDLISVIGALPPGEAQRFGAALVDRIEQQRRHLETGDVPEGITHRDAIAIIRQAQQRQAKLLKQQHVVFEIIAKLGLAQAQRRATDTVRAEKTAVEAVQGALKTRLGGPQVAALGLGFEIAAARDRQQAATLMEAFLVALAGTMRADPAFFASPRIRALFDGPIATATSIILEQLGDGDDPHARCRAAAMLDLLRRPDPPPPDILMPQQGRTGGGNAPGSALLAAADTLGRIGVALRSRQDTIALVVHSLGAEVAFLLLRSDDHPIERFVVGPEYGEATAALERAAYEARRMLPGKRQAADTGLASAGRRAFETFPSAVRRALRDHRTVLIAPDFRGRQDTVPFELMHDGDAYLGATHVMARFTSLAHMAATLDTRVRVPRRKRALVTAAPVVEGYDALDLAPLEQEEVTSTLTQRGFDAPGIDPARLSAGFFTDRLSHVDVLHVSAHGESGADLEWLVLPGGQRLVVDDLLQNLQYRVPFVYLNTCNLGQTRYLGAGVSRGLAYTFAELGAPAVVAHTTPVPDNAALRLAIAFYDQIGDRGVGEALLDARRVLLEAGESATAWSSAILIGDPDHRIAGERTGEMPDLASDVLDAYFGPAVDDVRKVEAWSAATDALAKRRNPRIEAALELVRAMSEVGNLDAPAEAAALDGAIAAADALRHLPARAMLRFVKANHAAEQGTSPETAALLEDAIRFLVPLAAFEPSWNGLLGAAREKLALHRASEKGLEIRTHLPPGQADDGSMRGIMGALMGAQQAVEDEYGRAAVRDVEADIDDIAWNAVVMGHPGRFEDVPESVAFAEQVARKLEQRGFLPASAMGHAPAMLAGLLRHLWDWQNPTYLGLDMAEGQAGTVRALLEDIRANWAPPDGKDWYAIVEPAPRLVDEVLAFIHGLSWEDVYKHLDARMDALAERLQAMLQQVQTSHSEALGGCAAYVTGIVMAKNTFSPLDGSVPESIGERLSKVYGALARHNESRFADYLAKGFEQVRKRPLDELARWRMEPEAAPAAAAPRGRPEGRSKRTRRSRKNH